MQNDSLQDNKKTGCNCDPLVPIQHSGVVENSGDIYISASMNHTNYLFSSQIIEPQFRAAIDNLAEGFTICSPITDSSGTITDFICRYANSALARMVKIDMVDLIGKRMSDLLPDLHERKLFRTCCETKNCNETRILSSVLFKDTVGGRNIDGSYDVTFTNCNCGVVITFHEVTAQRNAANDLARERELLERIIDSIPVMIAIYDKSLKNFRFNEEIHRLLGWSKDDASDSCFMEKVYPDLEYRQDVTNFMQSSNDGWRELKLMAKDGSQFECSWSNILLTEDTMIGIGIDLRQMKQTERQLRESQTRLLEAQRLAHVGSFTFDAASNMLEWTDEVFRILERDFKKGHPTFKEIMEYIHPSDREYVLRQLKDAEEKRTSINMEYRVNTESGICKHLRYIGTPIFDDEGRFIKRFGTVLDITETKLTELKLKKTLEELERSNKELEEFAYVASHDLQEPLRIVSNFAHLLSKQYSGKIDKNADSYIEYMTNGTRRMQTLINALLLYARVTTKANPIVLIDMNKVMENVLIDLKMAIDEKNAFIFYDKLPEIKADPVQMRQLFQNLITNAVKFSNGTNPEVLIKAEEHGNEWIFSIKDNGIGINPKFHERIFVLFQTLHDREKYPGTGIGLALCKKIVERHKGRIWVESEDGCGATFYFTIPGI